MKYTIYWCDNEACASRGHRRDEFYTEVHDFESDREALLRAIEIQGEDDFDPEDFVNHSDEDIKDCLFDIDLGFGSPVVFWIKRDSEVIYDAGIDEADFVGDPCEDDEEYDEDEF